jgi:hypothetical protein
MSDKEKMKKDLRTSVLLIIVIIFSFCVYFEHLGVFKTTQSHADPSVALYFSDVSFTVVPKEEFEVDLMLDTNGDNVSAVDVVFEDFEGVSLIGVNANSAAFKTSLPLGLPDSYAYGSKDIMLGFVSYDWVNGGANMGIEGVGIRLATLKFRADEGGSYEIAFKYDVSGTDDSNVLYVDETGVVELLDSIGAPISVCVRDCESKNCGTDGCGGSCGTCTGYDSCIDGVCKCIPQCDGKKCGDNACGGTCGTCGSDELCVEDKCVPKVSPQSDDGDDKTLF